MSDDVQIKISAQDAASRVLAGVGANTRKLDQDMGRLAKGVGSLKAAFGPLLAVFAAVKSVQAIGQMIGDANAAFLVQEKAARGMTDAHKAFANQMQRVAGVGDEVTLSMMKQASQMGIADEKLEDVIKVAAGLSEVMGTDIESALIKAAQAAEGNTEVFSRMIPGLRDMATEEEKLAAISDLASKGLQQKRDDMGQLIGIQQRATNSWGDMLEVIGQILAPIRAIISQGFAVFAETMQSALIPAVNLASAAMSALPAVFEYVNSAIVGAITFIEVVIGNFPAIVQMSINQTELYWIQLSESVKHILTAAMPSYLEWFGENWMNMLTDIFSAGLTLVQNYIRNYADALLALWDWVSSGFKGGAVALFESVAEIASRNLLEGFEATTASLPDVIARQITDREMELSAKIGATGAAIGTEFATKFIERMAAVNETFADFSTQANLTANEAASAMSASRGAGNQNLQASEGRLLTRGRSEDKGLDKVAKNTEKTVEKLDTLNTTIETLRPTFATPIIKVVG